MTKADGSLHRSFPATVEQATDRHLALVSGAGTELTTSRGVVRQNDNLRVYYWPGRRYNLLEFYDPSGRLKAIYSDIISPITIQDHQVAMVDHELDVMYRMGKAAEIIDQDEFAAAVVTYGYSAELQALCRQAADEALRRVSKWEARGYPASVSRHP